MEKLQEWGWIPLWLSMTTIAIWARPVIPIDETRYLSIAWEMWNDGQFLVPHSNGLPYSDKPPLLFWLINLGWWLFGTQEWVARLTSPLCSLLTIFICRKLAGMLFPECPAVQRRVPFLLLAILPWAILASLTMFDTLLTCSALASQLIILKASTGKYKYWWSWLGLSIGIGILAKGPVIYIYVLPLSLLAPWWSTRLPMGRRQWFLNTGFAIIVSMIVTLFWALPAAWQGGPDYAQSIFLDQTAGRVVNSFAHQQPFYWYVLILPLMLFPWSCYMPLWKGLYSLQLDNRDRFLLSILTPGFILLSLISGKQPHYLMPLIPAAVIVLAHMTLNQPKTTKEDRYVFYLIYGGIGIAISVLPLLPVGRKSAVLIPLLPKYLFFVPLVGAIPFFLAKYGQERITINRIASSSILLFIALHIAAAKPLHTVFEAPEIFKKMSSMDSRHSPIYVSSVKLTDQFQFSARLSAPVIPLSSVEKTAIISDAGKKGIAVYYLKQSVLPLLPEEAVAEVYKSGWLVLVPTDDIEYLPPVKRRCKK
jgi:4-amino-4-deoxy-L-arabinose transferase-like glycosyltransferase